jgi:chromosome segregation protein
LLKLRKVELVGFKSFCEKTHLTFSGAGLSCIIGPNGCGKSNIVDAISWVLGEQSHKTLRAERMSDCIFNGTAKRPPMGLAEVTLTLVDAELADAARRVLGDSEPVPISAQAAGDVTETSSESAEVAVAVDATETADTAPLEIGSAPADIAADKGSRKTRAAQKQALQSRPGEVVIGRRLYRSGQSEYLINGRAARLRDIQELFMGIGLGPDSYAIIEQGRIGQVLSSKPSDRRAIIEEAAGITKYKTKKRLAEAKLESSKLNLSRVNDIFVEVEKQLASLKRQASKARRYAEIREQMRGLLRLVLASKVRRLEAEADRLAASLAQIAEIEEKKSRALTELEAEQERLDRRSYELDAELRQNQNLIGQTALELDRGENRILFNRQRGEELAERARQLRADYEQAAAQSAQVESRVAAQDAIVARLQEDVAQLENALTALAARSGELSTTSHSAEARIAESRRQIQEFDQALARVQDAQAQTAQLLAHHSGALERLEKSEHSLLEESLNYRENSQAADLRWQAATERARSLERSVSEVQQQLAVYRRDQAETASRCEALRESLAAVRARRHALGQVLSDRSYSTETVQKLFASNGRETDGNFRAVGLLADYAEVDPQYETAVEQFLRDELEYVVVETFDHARAGITLLREEFGGRATFFVDSLRSLNLHEQDHPSPFFEHSGISRLDRLVEFRDPLGAAAKQFLPRLRSAFLVEEPGAAEQLARENPSYIFLTPDGTCYHGRAVTGGRPTEAGPLATKRELRVLEAEASRLENSLAELQSAAERLESERQQAEASLEQLNLEKVEAGNKLVAATLERDQARAELARLSTELAACQAEVEHLRRDSQSARQKADRATAEREAIIKARDAAEFDMAEANALITQLRQSAQAHQDEVGVKRAEKAGMAERLSGALAIAMRAKEEREELIARLSSLLAQQTTIQTEEAELVRSTEEYRQRVDALRAEREQRERQKADLESEADKTRLRMSEVDHTVRTARQTLSELREGRSRHEVERARNDADREHLRATCLNELNAHPEDLIVEQEGLLEGDALAASETQYQEMKSRVEAMGPVNMMALEEYNECEQRFTFLERERADLVQSIADTQQTIGELDQISRQKFEEAFAIINSHFANAFQALFGGGTGQMRLSEPDSSGEAGIDIATQPPGKRLQNVLLLSGGEKALAALALLIAVFRYQPSPFCILDEVDAPLDETNVGRFAQMVADMSADAQFIVVTHNRRTMERASVLYGVTMQEPGVSKLVSVNWEQARSSASHAA